jgi:hypothetical protein
MKFSRLLPSRWIQRLIIITVLLALIGWVIYYFVTKEDESSTEEILKVSFVDTVPENEVDTDSDGVPDWKERLWGLDPNSPDTDNDGVSDARYLQSRETIQERRELGIENVETQLSQSELFGRSIFTAVMAIQESGGEFDELTQEQISENIAEYINTIDVGGRLYVREDLNRVDDTKEFTYRYRDEVNRLLATYPIEPDDINILVSATEDNDLYEDEIAELSDQYDTLLNELALLEVPFLIAGRHTELLNSIAHLTGALKNLNQPEADELVSLASLIQMDRVLEQTQQAVNALEDYFNIIEDESVFEA